MPPAKLGLIYGHTGLQRFIDTIGVPRTKELFLTGRNLTAERAERIDLVHEVIDDPDVEAASLKLASEVAANAPLSLKGNKHAIEMLSCFPRLTAEQERELIELRESLLRLGGLPRGHRGLRREAQAALEGPLSEAGSRPRPSFGTL